MQTTPVVVLALLQTSSLSIQLEALEVGRKQGLDGWGSWELLEIVNSGLDWLVARNPSIQPLLPPNF
jgi:hypothetical protein